MKNMIHIRNSVIIILCVTIICLGIGFSVLAIRLKSEKDKVYSVDVSFVDISKSSSVKGSTIEPIGIAEVLNSQKELKFHFTLNSTHDEISYTAIIRNNGTLDAEIVDILESPDYHESSFEKTIYPVSITMSDLKGKVIPAGGEVELKIVAYYNPASVAVSKKEFDYKLGLIVKSH